MNKKKVFIIAGILGGLLFLFFSGVFKGVVLFIFLVALFAVLLFLFLSLSGVLALLFLPLFLLGGPFFDKTVRASSGDFKNACLKFARSVAALYGVKLLRSFDENEYIRVRDALIGQYGGPTYAVASSDSAYEYCSKRLRNLYRYSGSSEYPIQMLYFEGDSLVSYQNNRGNFRMLFGGTFSWKQQGRFKSFPPKSSVDIGIHSFRLSELKNLYHISADTAPYTLVFFYTNMLERHVRHAFKLAVKNIKKYHEGTPPLIILINSDKFFTSFTKELFD